LINFNYALNFWDLKVNVEYGGIKHASTQPQPAKQDQGHPSSGSSNALALPGIIL